MLVDVTANQLHHGLLRQVHSIANQRGLTYNYDKLILDNLFNPELARELREGLKNLYSVFKDVDSHLHFVLLTGISKFSKVSLFSGLHNLNNITLDAPFSAICD
ncbi:AAA family ATPase [Halomonas sp. HAL1]|uniref:AAA family ATPase n=1 Tax=Halomonas sp. HAL1 TaxID=550984 RepID=UPI00022D31C5|nr:AAA family ATPase [Halomonas sp. HAL1]EHA16472.1 hypothetical protein HAL1_06500 [Halomonas sp. HAL1]WKV92698.1 AAA family ATPase [Halomonas sp. HAL1]